MSEADGQKFLQDLDKKLWTAAEPNSKHEAGDEAVACRDQTCEVLFIDARELACMMDRFLPANKEDTTRHARTFPTWKNAPVLSPSLREGRGGGTTTRGGEAEQVGYRTMPDFCRSPTLVDTAEHGYVLTPGRSTCTEEVEDDGVPFAEKMEGLTRELATQFHESEKLQSAIRDNMIGGIAA
jgi:type I restriction enzyme M protein